MPGTPQPGFGRVCGSLAGTLSCRFAFALGLVRAFRFLISRIFGNPSKSKYIKGLGAVFGSIVLGSLFGSAAVFRQPGESE